ncbi:MAG: radical SAM protein [Verrucomicrobiae bacterium]|nr:radical SAM protein [Verrucomicrobiae bacterium]
MRDATTLSGLAKAGVEPGDEICSKPLSQVPKPRKSVFKLISEVLAHGGPGYLQFAITNRCNADCGFCNFARSKLDRPAWRSVTLEQARDVVDICRRNHIGYLLFVGGEPMLHRDLVQMTRYAAERGIRPMLCTNGALFTDRNIHALANAGLSSVIISIDTHDAVRHEQNRGLPAVCEKIKRANAAFSKLGVNTTASVTISRLIDDYGRLPAFLRELGFESCTFSYPLTALGSSYLSYSHSPLVSFAPEELIAEFEKIKQLKRQGGFVIVNPTESLTEMQRHLRGEPERFGCLAGFKYFYLDWDLNLYRCHFWDKPMCTIYEFDHTRLIRDNCTRCMIDCYRDPSVLHFCAISVHDAWQALKRGRVGEAAHRLLDRRNLISLAAVLETRPWITGL